MTDHQEEVQHENHVEQARSDEQSPGEPGTVKGSHDVVEGEVQVNGDHQDGNGEGKQL